MERETNSSGRSSNFSHVQPSFNPDAQPQDPLDLAQGYVESMRDQLGIGNLELSLDTEPSKNVIEPAIGAELRLGNKKSFMETNTITFVQTYFGLQLWQAGISVTVQNNPSRVSGSHSTIHHDAAPEPPNAKRWYMPDGIEFSFPSVLGKYVHSHPALRASINRNMLKINDSRLWIYQYRHADRYAIRADDHVFSIGEGVRHVPPTLRLDDVPITIRDGQHYVVTEVLFSLSLPHWGNLNWRAFVEVETGTVLYLRSFVSGLFGSVFPFDPVTLSGDPSISPGADDATLRRWTEDVELLRLRHDIPPLIGDYVKIEDISGGPVLVQLRESVAPDRLDYSPHTEAKEFSVVNAYYHCDDAFRMIEDLGFRFRNSFAGGSPVGIDPWASTGPDCEYADCTNAVTIGNAAEDGVQGLIFSQINSSYFLSLATDKRAVLHESGHALLYEAIGSPNLGTLSHSVGDSLAAIHCDPHSQLTGRDRFATFPWISFSLNLSDDKMRRHDRSIANGWGWGGDEIDGNYHSEQILTTTLFRAYLAAGGDATHHDPDVQRARRRLAARFLMRLIVGAVGSLPPNSSTPVDSPEVFAHYLMHTDIGTPDFEGRPGGTLPKVISWAFEKQGLIPDNGGSNAEGEGIPAFDAYIDDGRDGEYSYQENFWSSSHVWNRVGEDGTTEYVHQTPVLGTVNYVYVRITNRGTQSADHVVVRVYSSLLAAGSEWPHDWTELTPASIPHPDPIDPEESAVVGPFEWTPTETDEFLLAVVTTPEDQSNIDLGGAIRGPYNQHPYPCATGPTSLWQLVPFDNNIALRNVAPVPGAGGRAQLAAAFPHPGTGNERIFRVKNPYDRDAEIVIEWTLPDFLTARGWQLELPDSDTRLTLHAKDLAEISIELRAGDTFTSDQVVESGESAKIEIRALIEGQLIGGITYEIDPDMAT